MAKPFKIITVRQLGGIGDCLMLTPVFRGLREKYPKATICHVTGNTYLGGALMDVFSHVPKGFIDEIHPFEPWDAAPLRTREVWANYYGQSPPIEEDLWWKKADLHYDLNVPCVDYEWPAMHSPEGICKSRTQVWCDFAEVKPSSLKPMYEVRPEERKQALQLFESRGWDPAKVIGLGATACDKKRAVGIGKLESICASLKDAGYIPVIIDPTFNLEGYGALNGQRLRDLMAAISLMRVMISVDSGALHMAGTLGVPVVGIFGPTDYRYRMDQYLGSAVDSRQLTDCAPCWYGYQCTKQDSRRPAFDCLNKIPARMIVDQALMWADEGYRQSHRSKRPDLIQLPVYNS